MFSFDSESWQNVSEESERFWRDSGFACQQLGFTSSWQVMQQIFQTVLIEVTVELYWATTHTNLIWLSLVVTSWMFWSGSEHLLMWIFRISWCYSVPNCSQEFNTTDIVGVLCSWLFLDICKYVSMHDSILSLWGGADEVKLPHDSRSILSECGGVSEKN